LLQNATIARIYTPGPGELMRNLVVVSILLGAVISIAAEKQVSTNTPGHNPSFAKLAEQYMYESLAISPVNASYAGYHQHSDVASGKSVELDSLLDDVSPAGWQKQIAFYRDWQKRFQTEVHSDQLSVEDKADWRLIDDSIALSLLQLERMQTQRSQPQMYVELLGNGIFLPLTQNYAPKPVRIGHVLKRIDAIPAFLEQTKKTLAFSDPIFLSTAKLENEGNIDLVQTTVKEEISAGSSQMQQYDAVAPKAIAALKDFGTWLDEELAMRKPTETWRIGKDFYAEKFRLVMQTEVHPDELLGTAERELKDVRAEMLQLALPMHKQMYPDHADHTDVSSHDRENKIISEVLQRISDEHPKPDQLLFTIEADLDGIKQFIREKKIVALGSRDNLKVIPTPQFMRGIFSVAGFHSAPPLEPTAEAQYWVTPIDPSTPADQAESKLREYNNYTLKWLTIHEALPGHYVQFEHANNLQPENRRVLRNLFGNGAYIEGWAEYIAQIMMDEGFLDNNPKFRMIMRKLRLRLLANTILDIRMQTMNMSDDEAMKLMVTECFQTEAEAKGKLRRAKLSSTQLPTYYVGLRDWLQLRQDYQKKLGPKFNNLEFHNLVLDQGPLPIMYLRQIVMR
jgi:uncharacterized protein (DUF885 family)